MGAWVTARLSPSWGGGGLKRRLIILLSRDVRSPRPSARTPRGTDRAPKKPPPPLPGLVPSSAYDTTVQRGRPYPPPRGKVGAAQDGSGANLVAAKMARLGREYVTGGGTDFPGWERAATSVAGVVFYRRPSNRIALPLRVINTNVVPVTRDHRPRNLFSSGTLCISFSLRPKTEDVAGNRNPDAKRKLCGGGRKPLPKDFRSNIQTAK